MTQWDREKVIESLHALEIKFGRRPVKRDNANLYFLSRKFFGSWNEMMKLAGYEVTPYQEAKLPDLKSDSLYYFLGLLSTDGHIVFNNKNGYKIMLFTSYKEEREMILRLVKNLFEYNASIREKLFGFSKRINYEIYISSKKLAVFLVDKLNMPPGAKSLTIEIPKAIVNGNKSQIASFIRAVIDGDGSIIKTEKSSMLKVVSGSKKFIEELQLLFEKLGIFSGKIAQERENLWVLRFSTKEDIKKLYPIIYKDAEYYYNRKEKIWRQYI